MKTRASLGLATAVALALILLVLPTTGIGQGKTRDIPVDVTFRNDPGDMIGGDTVAARIDTTGGALWLTDNDDTGHRVHVLFDKPTGDAPSPYNCKEWGSKPFTWYMASAYDLSTPTIIQVRTLNQLEYVAGSGWVPVMNPPSRKGTTAHILDLRNDVPPGAKRYVQVMIRLFVNSSNDMYEIWMNRGWPTESGYGYGVFEIEAGKLNAPAPGAAGDTFKIRPLVAGQPYPLQGLSENEALLYMVDYSEGGLDPSGPCNMGNFMMPFEMTVTRK